MDMMPAWKPTKHIVEKANISHFMSELSLHNIKEFHRWTVAHYPEFWAKIIETLGIIFQIKPNQICDLRHGVESPQWLPGAKLNIADSCFNAAPDAIALICQTPDRSCQQITYAELDQLSNRIANSLVSRGFVPGDAIAITMPMNINAVAIYLGIIKMGGIVVSIADSFSSHEIAVRLQIAKAKAVFTQDTIVWAGKSINLYEKINAVEMPVTIIRTNDQSWADFLSNNTIFTSVPCDAMATCNILFSSGTTGLPKAIPWNHTTAIKAASDGYFHQNIQPGDITAWPTNLGWMMGPWLVFATLINRATLALYPDNPRDRAFGEFVEQSHVTMLGVVPTLVAYWKQSKCMEGLNWNHINLFSSTGECSNAEDMQYLMSLGNHKPVIEYCGGTEIGGAYVSSTIIEDNYPALFSTPAMGMDFIILNDAGEPADIGEVAIIPPSMGLSTTLLNGNHQHVYFENMPRLANGIILRRHGDKIERLANGYYSILGRIDDTMNLGGIKISAVEIERVLVDIPGIIETAAIAVPSMHHGPAQLIIFATTTSVLDKKTTLTALQKRINTHLNPLFKIHDIVFVNELPKTASNKILRRQLRENIVSKAN